MWSKRPFNRTTRRQISNPIPAEALGPAPADHAPDKPAKDLPVLPYDLDSTLHSQPSHPIVLPYSRDGGDKRYSAVSPLASPVGSGKRGSGSSSFSVSPIDDNDQLPRHERNDSRASASASHRSLSASHSLEVLHPTAKTVQFTPSHDDFSGEPSQPGKTILVNPQNTSSHKASAPHTSNLLHWGREQLYPKKKLTQARNRIGSSSKNEPPQPESRSRSSSRVFPLGEHSNHSGSIHGESNLSTLGFVPSVVTTITAGGPKSLPERPAPGNPLVPPKSSRRYLPEPKFDPGLDEELEDMMQPAQPAEQFGVVNTVAGDGITLEAPIPNESPRGSLNFENGSTDDLSIMSRRRPVPNAKPTSKPISKKPVRKPTPSEAGRASVVAQPPVNDQPKDAQSRIESLEARRDELAKRRFALETVIKELTRVIQPTSYAYDQAAKAEVKRSVQSIENEIAEIKREEHELGMKVTRAWRRLDEKENNGDGSNLWVKRVTS
ncbi:hypothetical protein N7448_006905 [Penicillium atrosanguineum]|uniref:uncharacterized protein n=1 Tax=Penicillium atrosanguineum TaxID=1132637 RepID=UPI00239B2E72|nr:uncharacterized protein N7443_010667 [Penicillium atrosanguineum]KAJ5132747.1 hypothetical protein N7448_006905 [Penicillium atrosanguineum]KAJ5141365.1 hypothetical protein N7526_002360 [Penicillium atrosanguineum]KAJ5290414.1 hypothetical protein N7443_010667 [Penicillium atrosanguineum]